jgi:hypothetical protein
MTKHPDQFAREKSPCVVIDYDAQGNTTVYADRGVLVYSRSAHIPEDALYRYAPHPIPDGWLDVPAGYLGDGSEAEKSALLLIRTVKENEPSG